jgi:DNA-binding NtrC family response regulator
MAEKIYPNLLVVDDDDRATHGVLEVVARCDIRATVAGGVREARDRLSERRWDVMLVDVESLGAGALELIGEAKQHWPELPVIALGAAGNVDQAVLATRRGADELLVRPVEPEALGEVLETLLPNHDIRTAGSDEAGSTCLYQIAGKSPKLIETLRMAEKVAPTSVPVLITGESGTGKELVSYLVHRRSRRSSGPYVRVNCAALSESLLESELFGHERGAFTGAVSQRKGRFELAHGGTLLLDEISETTGRLQAELLRVLESQDFERVGGTQRVEVNVRVLATTNRDLLDAVRKGQFRRDLYYRLAGVRLNLAPLRDRREDIEELAWFFVNHYAREVRRKIQQIDAGTLELFDRCPWPGNVRQLRNAVRTALILGEGPVLSIDDAPHLRAELEQVESPDGEVLSLRELERQAIFQALRKTKSHQAKAAELLGITDRTLREKLRRYRQDDRPIPAEVRA